MFLQNVACNINCCDKKCRNFMGPMTSLSSPKPWLGDHANPVGPN